MKLVSFLGLLLLFQLAYFLEYEDNDGEPVIEPFKYDLEKAYCFQFTWLGPDYGNVTTPNFNSSCSELLEDNKDLNVPCKPPLVITNSSTAPNLTYLFEHSKSSVLKELRSGESCVKYSYTLNKALKNVTYMRSKVLAVNEGPVYDGCYTQQIKGTEVELCVCRTEIGYKPCNSSSKNGFYIFLNIFCFILIFVNLL